MLCSFAVSLCISKLELHKDTEQYAKINEAIKNVGYKLKSDVIQYSIVKYETGHFIYKHNHIPDAPSYLTCVIQMSDGDDYEGGDLLYWIDGEKNVVDRNIGFGIIMSPDIDHEVTLITNGTRYSFVLFLELFKIEPLFNKAMI